MPGCLCVLRRVQGVGVLGQTTRWPRILLQVGGLAAIILDNGYF